MCRHCCETLYFFITESIPIRSAVSNNFPVKLPVRHPCRSFEQYLFEIPHPETEARSRILCGLPCVNNKQALLKNKCELMYELSIE
ncbi:hypothetical protein SHPE106448_21395 [Shewanella pealeana]